MLKAFKLHLMGSSALGTLHALAYWKEINWYAKPREKTE